MSAGETETAKAGWGELFRGDLAIYTFMVMLGVVLFSIQILIIVTIMPTVVAEIGGAPYYVWASMLYQVGAIVGAACIGPLWRAVGMRNGFLITATVYALGTLGCALAPDMLVLNASRTVQGFPSRFRLIPPHRRMAVRALIRPLSSCDSEGTASSQIITKRQPAIQSTWRSRTSTFSELQTLPL